MLLIPHLFCLAEPASGFGDAVVPRGIDSLIPSVVCFMVALFQLVLKMMAIYTTARESSQLHAENDDCVSMAVAIAAGNTDDDDDDDDDDCCCCCCCCCSLVLALALALVLVLVLVLVLALVLALALVVVVLGVLKLLAAALNL